MPIGWGNDARGQVQSRRRVDGQLGREPGEARRFGCRDDELGAKVTLIPGGNGAVPHGDE